MFTGIPSDTSIGIRIIAAPTPPSEKINAATNDIIKINVSILFIVYRKLTMFYCKKIFI